MIRVMVTSIDSKTREPTIVWGFDDASFLYRVQTATPDSGSTTLTLASAPVDSYHYPAQGQAVELLRDAVRLTTTDYIASPTGFVSALTGAYDPASRNLVISRRPGRAAGRLPARLPFPRKDPAALPAGVAGDRTCAAGQADPARRHRRRRHAHLAQPQLPRRRLLALRAAADPAGDRLPGTLPRTLPSRPTAHGPGPAR